jgi:hypothetical protein
MSDDDRARTDPGDVSPSFPGTHAIANRVNAAQVCRTASGTATSVIAVPALRNLWFLRNSAMKQN